PWPRAFFRRRDIGVLSGDIGVAASRSASAGKPLVFGRGGGWHRSWKGLVRLPMSDLAFKKWTTIGVSAGVGLALAACRGGGRAGDDGGRRFVSDIPLGPLGGDAGDAGYSGDGGETGAAGEDGGDDGADPGNGQGGDDEGGDGTRDTTEADIIAVEGDRL